MTRLPRDLGFLLSIAAAAACGGGGGGGDRPDAPPIDAPTIDTPTASFGLTAIFPAAASRTIDSPLTISGFGITGTPTIRLTNCDQTGTTFDLTAGTTTATSIATVLAADPARAQGAYTVTVTNGDGLVAQLVCALHIVAEPPPTVTTVVASTAWQGLPTDKINSDVTVSIQGTGFLSTPNVRWVLRANPAIAYDALFVGFISDTRLTAVVPSETLSMPAGDYDVFVTNPDQLSAQWRMQGGMAGTFTVTGTAPPRVTDVSPARIQNGTCTTTAMTITGTDFSPDATAWYLAPAGTSCTGSITDANGNLLCPMTVQPSPTASAITTLLPSCPKNGPYPVVVINGDGQASYWFSIEITPSSSGHLNVGAFEPQGNQLETARWKHALQYGFDAFSDALVYVAGGQDAQNTVLGSVEFSRFDLFGVPGPFHHVEQYKDKASPRVANDLTVPREGATLVRVGASLFAIGGTTQRSDTTTVVAASDVVERAEILGLSQMPAVMQPAPQAQTQGLPLGSWYYRVAAVGPWGESLATREVVAINQAGQIQVCWQAPTAPGVASYNVYRSLASDGRAGTSAAIAYDLPASTTCWMDTGTAESAPGPGNLRGSLAAGGTLAAGTYAYRVSAVVPLASGTRETYAGYASSTAITAADVTAGNQTITVAWDALPIPGATYRVYRLDPATGTYKRLTGADGLTSPSFSDTGLAFDAGGATVVSEIRPLPPGSLSKWSATATPHLNFAREGLDGVAVRLDPTVSGGLVGRILVAGGRDGTGGTYTYRTTAESLGIHEDGTTDAAWSNETPVFTNARTYYALLTTQDRNETPFPPPPEQAPCNDCSGGGGILLYAGLLTTSTTTAAATVPSEPVYVVAAQGDDAFSVSSNAGRSDFEACAVDMTTGHLAADCGVAGATKWVVQTNTSPQSTFGADAVLYFSFLYPFYGVSRETVGATASLIQIINAAITRFPLFNLTAITGGQVLDTRQSASTSFVVPRAYFQMSRLLAYVYVVGGFRDAFVDSTGATVPAGPTGLVERHEQ